MLIIPKGTFCHTIASDPDYKILQAYYISYKPHDILVYEEKFPLEIRDREGNTPVYNVTSTPLKDLKILEYDEAKVIFDKLYRNNRKLKLQTDMILRVFLASFRTLQRPLVGRELLIRELLTNVYYGDTNHIYDAFEVSFELDLHLCHYPYQVFINALRRKGFDGIIDIADIRYNTYNVIAPVVIFNPERMQLIDSQILHTL